MKTAYIYYSYIGISPGVEKALQGKAQAAATIKPNGLDFYALTPTKEGHVNNIHYVQMPKHNHLLYYTRHFFGRYRYIAQYVDLDRYDCVVLRYPLADRTGRDFMEQWPIITEHHTDELSERFAAIRTAPSPASQTAQAVQFLMERFYAPSLLRRCQGIIGVTNEIKEIELKRAGKKLPAAVIPNGIDVAAVPPTGFRPFDGRNLDIVMVAGRLSPWHGFDRVLAGLNRYKGRVQITLHLIGNVDRNTLQKMGCGLQHVRLHGFQTGQVLDDLMSGMHLAIGSLALHRNQMKEACVLKTREYTARGIPFVLAYDDPDLLAVDEDRCFYLSLPNDETAVDMEEIIAFADRMSQNQATISNYMRQYAINQMDWQIKMRQYLDFVCALES